MVAAYKLPSVPELAADDVIATLYASEEARNQAFYEMGLRPAHFTGKAHSAACAALETLHKRGETPHDTTLRSLTGEVVSLEQLAQWVTLYDDTRLRAFPQNVAIVKKHGLTAGARQLLTLATQQLDKGEPLETVTSNLITVLMGLDKSHTIKNETAAAIADSFVTMMNSVPPPLLLTGLPWLDGLTGGVDKGHMWWIAAPYKSRKSTVMLNVALGLLMTWVTKGCSGEPPSIGIASGEMPRQRIAAQMVAMLAVAYIQRTGQWRDTFTINASTAPLHYISPTMLLQARVNYRKWDARRVAAVDYGIAQFRKFEKALRVYDRTPDGGSLADVKQLVSVMKRDIHRYGTNVFMVDYLQIFKGAADAKLFDYVSNASLELQKFSASEQVTLIILAQQNEETIKSGSSYSAGIKGGGDPTATADYLITSRYKSGDLTDENQLELTMRFSRHGSGGGNVQQLFNIHPYSGLLLDSSWIERIQP